MDSLSLEEDAFYAGRPNAEHPGPKRGKKKKKKRRVNKAP